MINNCYSVLAKFYDKFTRDDCDYVRWSQYLCKIASGSHEIVDIACGTGKMTELLCEKGFVVTGVDASPEMLNLARQKCRATFVCQDMRSLTLAHPVDMAVCVNDGVNYLKPQQLEPFFSGVARNLKKGAPFVFDISSSQKLTHTVGNNVFYWDDDNMTLLWSNRLRGNSVVMELVLFERNGCVYTRSDERHVQYIYTEEDVISSLEAAGFVLREVTDSYGKKKTELTSRLTFYAQRR